METMLSPLWGSIADLKPRLAPNVRSFRQSFRGNVWYILQDTTTGRFHRFSPVAHYLVALMDGQRSFQTLWDMALERWGDGAPSQTEIVRLIAQLYLGELIRCDMSADVQALLLRSDQKKANVIRQKLMSPFSIRVPLLDPDRFLDASLRFVAPLFNRISLALWLAVVISGLVLAGIHWQELTGNFADRVFAPDNLVVLLCIYPLVKLCHELGHAYAVKYWGGEVHDIGVLFLIFMPVPYVDASAASAFTNKHQRMLVGAAGIMVELVLASIAMWIWTEAQPGMLRSIAFNVMLVGGISTLFFNGNPLLRYDGYYVFSDALEIPNLASRSTQYLGYLVQRFMLRSRLALAPEATTGENRWFVFYGLASFAYRISIMVTMVMFIAGRWFFVGVVLALWAANSMVVLPLWRKLRFLAHSPLLADNRGQAILISSLVMALLTVFIVLVPIPSYTTAEAVVWVSDSAEVRASKDGFLVGLYEASETRVEAGAPLFKLEDTLLSARINVLQNRAGELLAKFQAQLRDDPGQAQITRAEYQTIESQLARAQEQDAALQLTAPHAGTLLIADADSMEGRYYHQGDLLGYVAQFPVRKALAVVQQDFIGQVRRGVESVELRFASDVSKVWPALILRQIPASTSQLPSSALGDMAGGRIKTDPQRQDPSRAFEPVFQFELELPEEASASRIGERVYLRFYHGNEALATQFSRIIRRIFLKRFDI